MACSEYLNAAPLQSRDWCGRTRAFLRVQEVRAHAAEGVPVLLVGNKIDLAEAGSRAVPQDWGRVFAEVRGGRVVDRAPIWRPLLSHNCCCCYCCC